MNRGRVDGDRTELIKWWDVVEAWTVLEKPGSMLQMARECKHPDARWLVSLFPPADVTVRLGRVHEVMLEQGDDPRALFLAWASADDRASTVGLLERSAAMGFAPAQVVVAARADDEFVCVEWLEQAAAQGHRGGFAYLGRYLFKGWGCAKDERRGIELLKQAAELEHREGLHFYGELAFEAHDWERYYWRGRAVAGGHVDSSFFNDVFDFLPLFAKGKHGRILHAVAPVLRNGLNLAERRMCCFAYDEGSIRKFQRVIELHDAVLVRAKAAIACWSVVGLRRRVVKDIRAMIGKMAWEEAWRWS